MLLLVGNTLEHYGIFTLDDAHADHDHSRNNREHADVWASTEETLRIGAAADRDIYGRPAKPVFAGYSSGFDGSRPVSHFHYAGVTLRDFELKGALTRYISWLSAALAIGGSLIMVLVFRSSSGRDGLPERSGGFDLTSIRWVRRFVNWKYFRAVFIVPVMAVFLLIILLGFFDVQDGRRNVSTVYTWTLWWGLIIFSFIMAGRLWCMMCPFAAIGDLAQKVLSLNRRLPAWLRNMGFQTLAFIVLTLAFALFAFDRRPFVTALVIVLILAGAVLFSVIYERRSFCRHICPIGAVIGIYSILSPVEIRPSDRESCSRHRRKTCQEACPMLESPQEMDNNVYCNFCMKCRSACPSCNLGLRLRLPGREIYTRLRRPASESLAALFLMGIIIFETLAMTSSWEPLKNSLSGFTGIASPTVIYLLTFTLVVLLPVGLFYLVCYLLRLSVGRGAAGTHDTVFEFAFVFIPLGIALHLAHNIQHLVIEGPVALPATVRFLQNLGIGESLFVNWNPLPLMGLEPLFFIQMGIIVAGLALTMYFLYRMLGRRRKPLGEVYATAVVMSFFALAVVLSSIYMLGLPMSGRHIH
jgi:ferredoxin